MVKRRGPAVRTRDGVRWLEVLAGAMARASTANTGAFSITCRCCSGPVDWSPDATEILPVPGESGAMMRATTYASGSTSASGATAGPFTTLPRGSKREPWQGQSQVFSVEFQSTMQ
jgi:hypothetical protein